MTEAFVVLFGVLSLWFAFLLRGKVSEKEITKPLLVPKVPRVDFVVTSDELDDSRYG